MLRALGYNPSRERHRMGEQKSPDVLFSCGCRTNYQSGVAYTTGICPLAVPEARVWDPGVSGASLPLKTRGKNPSLPLPAPGAAQHSLAGGSITPAPASVVPWSPALSVCVSNRPLSFLPGHLSLDRRPPFIQDDVLRAPLHLQRPFTPPKRPHSQDPGLGLGLALGHIVG